MSRWKRWQSGLGLQATGHIRVMLVRDHAHMFDLHTVHLVQTPPELA